MTSGRWLRGEIKTELTVKRKRIVDMLKRTRMDAVLISRHENIAWATAGLVDVRIGVLKETGSASLLIAKDGEAYYLTTNNEAPRLADEEFADLDYKPLVQPWYANDMQASIDAVVGGGAVGTDAPFANLAGVSLQALRFELTEGELDRYRWLGRTAAKITTDLARELRPGMTETTIQSRLAQRFIDSNILPSVYLTAVDARIRNFRHAVPRSGVLQRFGMLNFCVRKWGLALSMTRLVHFGAMPTELEEKFGVVAEVNAQLQAVTRAGRRADALFGVAQKAYAAAGFAGEETMHHQGGAIGYLEREWIARPGGTEEVCSTQAFAWNPSLKGAKVEDTLILHNGEVEVITATPELPVVVTRVGGVDYRSAGVLIA